MDKKDLEKLQQYLFDIEALYANISGKLVKC